MRTRARLHDQTFGRGVQRIKRRLRATDQWWGGGVLPTLEGVCRREGYGSQAIKSGIGARKYKVF